MVETSNVGDLFTIVSNYSPEDESHRFSLRSLNRSTNEWELHETSKEVIDVKFTGQDAMITQDNNGNIYDHSAKYFSTPISKIWDFGVTTSGHLHLIFDSELISEEDKNGGLAAELAARGLQATVYFSDEHSAVWVRGEEAILTDVESNLIGFGNACVTDLSVATDDTLWAVNCSLNPDSEYEEFQLATYNPELNDWNLVRGAYGLSVAASSKDQVVVLNAVGELHKYENT